jgi:hypothetical protein
MFGIANGALLVLGDTLIHPTLVLAPLISELGGSNALAGLMPAISTGFWLFPQTLAAVVIQRRRRLRAWAGWPGLLRAWAILSLGLVALVGAQRQVLLWLIPISYAIYNLAAGFAFVPLVEQLTRAIPSDVRVRFFSQRNVWGSALAFLAGLLVARALSSPHGALRSAYGTIFLASFAALALASYASARVSDPPLRQRPHGQTIEPIQHWIADLPTVLRQSAFRRFLSYRTLVTLASLADPFLLIYAQLVLGAPARFVGLALMIMATFRFVSSPLWGWIVGRWGNRLALQLIALLRALMPLLALALPPLLSWTVITDRLPASDPPALLLLYSLIFALYGAVLSGQGLTNLTYPLEIAEPTTRPAFIGLSNTAIALVSLTPPLGGVLLDHFGFVVLFLVTLALAFAAVLTSGMLPDVRRTQQVRASSRLRRVSLR